MKKLTPILQIRELDEHWKKRVSAPSVDMKLVKFSFLSKSCEKSSSPSCLLRDLGFCLGLNHFHHEKLVKPDFLVERYLKFKPLVKPCLDGVPFMLQRLFLQLESV